MACSQINLVRNQYIKREVEIIKQKNKKEVKLDSIYGYTKYSPYSDKGDLVDENIWPNTAIARYYNVSKITKNRKISSAILGSKYPKSKWFSLCLN